MRLLRRYVATKQAYCDGILINNYEIATSTIWYFYVHSALNGMVTSLAGRFVYTSHRKSYIECKSGFAIPLRLICFAYPYVVIYNSKHILHIRISENGMIFVKE